MPISFTCPHCNTTTEADDQHAGHTGPCASCGKTVVIPGGPAPAAGSTGRGSAKTVLLIIAAIMIPVILLCGGILLALLLPAIQAAREAARMAQCRNHMKQIGLAMLSYESEYQSFPPAYIADEDGKPMHSWRVLILPYVEEQALHDQYDFSRPWDSPENQAVADFMPSLYRCPSSSSAEGSTETNYFVIVGDKTAFPGAKCVGMEEISRADGVSQTIMLVEMAGQGIDWLEPKDLDIEDVATLADGTSSPHSYGARNVATCDCASHVLGTEFDEETWRAMAEYNDGTIVNPW